MTERDAFIRAIAENMYDDTPRLAFADWLDERGEHDQPHLAGRTRSIGAEWGSDRAEFIRVQVELEPIRDKYEIPRAEELHAREEHFGSRGCSQSKSAREWLGAMPEGWDKWDVKISIEFRRGFPDTLALSAKLFLEHGAAIRALHPTIRRVVIHCLNGWGERLATSEALNGLCELELACWYSDDDIKALGASPHLGELQVLELWLGRVSEVGTDSNLCKLVAKAKAWPKLRELTLLDPEGEDKKRITRLVTSVNRAAKRKIGRYQRGYPALFPLNGAFYYDWPVAGRLPDGRAGVVYRGNLPGALLVRTFDLEGAPTDEEISVPVPQELANATGDAAENWDGKFTQVVRDALGFEPGFIRVKENALACDYGPWRGHGNDWDRCGLADDPEDPTDYNGDPSPNGIGGEISWLIRGGEFVVRWDAWADKRGTVHST